MTSQRPYLLRAIYEWIEDCGETPYLLVDASVDGVVVPAEHIEDNQIVLNIGAGAVRDLNLGNEFVMFDSRFNGVAMEITLPVDSIKAIYCKDSGEGMAFPDETREQVTAASVSAENAVSTVADAEGDDLAETPAPPTGGKPTLKLV